MPSVMLLAAVLAVEDVSFLLVGSGALWLRGTMLSVGDVDAVIEPGEANLDRLRETLTFLSIGRRAVPPRRDLNTVSVVSVTTSYGRLDCMLERGRLEWHRLRSSATMIPISGVDVAVAPACDAWSLRHQFKA